MIFGKYKGSLFRLPSFMLPKEKYIYRQPSGSGRRLSQALTHSDFRFIIQQTKGFRVYRKPFYYTLR